MDRSKKPKIVILNSSSFGKHFPEHREVLEGIGSLSRVDVPNNLPDEVLASKLHGAHAIIASVTPKISAGVLERLPELILVARHGIGCDNVDLPTATELGILVSKVDGIVEREAVSEHAVALLLSAARTIPKGFQSVCASRWSDRANYVGLELKGKTVGIIGIGNIGSRAAEILSLGFQAKVIANDPILSPEEIHKRHARSVSLEELFQTSDVITFHCPLTENTRRMLNAKTITMLKKGVIIVNTCRGELLDEAVLCDALESGIIRAYATDVVEGEPIDGNHRLVKQQNVIVVPHLGGFTTESLLGMGDTMVKDVQRVFVDGTLPGVLANPEVKNRTHRKWL